MSLLGARLSKTCVAANNFNGLLCAFPLSHTFGRFEYVDTKTNDIAITRFAQPSIFTIITKTISLT